ncbi:MAG: electron transport complex subunit RsxC [Oceanococcus sp.]
MFGLFRKQEGFNGGLKLDGHKLRGEAGKIRPAPLPSRVILPLSQHIGAPTTPEVKVGDRVLRGQLLANSDSFIAAPVHASISGTVVAIGEHAVPHPSGLAAMAIVIESDGLDQALSDSPLPACEDPFSLDAQTLRERVRAAGLVGLGGAAFPSAVKLNPGRDTLVNTLVINGAECEPYISCDAALMRERADQIVAGAELVRRVLGAQECLIGIEDNAVESAAPMRAAIEKAGYSALKLRVVATRYPQGGEKQLIQTLTGREVPSEGLPLDIGIVVQNVGTVAALWNALRYGQPLISRVLTVTGPGIRQPQNLEVRLGTPVHELIAHAGGTTQEKVRLIMGGPMMGFALPSDQVPVVKATNCLLVEVNEPEPADAAMPCIRCGECVDVCPASLLPQQLYWHAKAKEFDKAQDLHLFDCIECGCCAQVCPSHIPLVQYYRYAKTEISQAEQEKRKADLARTRHEFRQERLEREAHEKEEARRRKREALKQAKSETTATQPATTAAKPAGNDAIATAIAKAKAEKSKRQAGPESAANPATPPDAIAAAIAKAKAAKAAASDANADSQEPSKDVAADAIALAKAKAAQKKADAQNESLDPVAAAIAKAKAAKAAKAEKSPAAQDSDKADDPIAAAIAKAKAAKAAKQAGDEKPVETPSAAAIAIAKAKAARQTAEQNDGHASDPVAAAIAKAKAAKTAKLANSEPSDANAGDAVATAIARAKAAKAARENPS